MSHMPGDHISVKFSNVGHEKESMMFPLDGEEKTALQWLSDLTSLFVTQNSYPQNRTVAKRPG